MIARIPRRLPPVVLLLAALLPTALGLAGCSQPQRVAPPTASNPANVDFSGSWELDYGQSDNIQVQLNALVRDLRRQAERQQQVYGGQTVGPAVYVGSGGGPNSGTSIIGLAQLADMITQAQLLEITQDAHDIRVKREGDFALTCEFYPGQFHTEETPLGSEVCGWNAHQLVFRLLLPEGLAIQHVFSISPDRQRLNIATTVKTDQVSSPFTLNRVYNRFEPGDEGFSCKMTVSRGRVCTTERQ